MPFDSRLDSDAAGFRVDRAIDWSAGGQLRFGGGFEASAMSFEAVERLATFGYRAHALTCCPCGEDHSNELLAHKISLAVNGSTANFSTSQDGPQFAPPGTPEAQTLSIPDEVAGSTATTVAIVVGDIVNSQIEVSLDQDWYRITLQAGVTYEFRLTSSGTSPLGDPYLELMDAAGAQVKFNDDGAGNFNSLLRYTPTSTGTFYLNAHGWVNPATSQSSTGSYTLTTGVADPLPTWTIDQIANYLVNEESAGLGPRWQTSTITYNIEDLTTAEQALAERALQMWSAASSLNFVRTTSSASITFVNSVADDPASSGDTDPAAYARTSSSGNSITSSRIVISSNWATSQGGTAFDSYMQQTYIHEVGHALGLSHSGPYDGSADYGTDNLYTNDNWAYTVMSYFDQLEAGHGNFRYVLGLQQADIAAIQLLYGTNPSGTYAGNTTFGFNSSAPGTNIDWSQFVLVQPEGTYRRPPAMTLYDTSGVDTINLSGFSQPQIVDLRPGTFSSLGDRPDPSIPHYVNVVAIAANTIIENVIGGSGNDTITGNTANNTITFGAGADTFVYGANGGADTITDFSVAQDRIDLTAFSSSVALAAFNGRTSSAGGTLLTFASGQTILLQGVSTGQLTQANLVLASSPPPPPPPPPAPTVIGTPDNDNLYGTAWDVFFGGAGYDTVWMTDLETAGLTINMTIAQVERIYATNRADYLDGSGTSVGIVLYGFAGADVLLGGSGSDYIYAGYEAVQNGTVRGGSGYDYLIHDSNSLYTGTLTINMNILEVEGVFGSARAEVINAAGLSTFATIYTGGGADTVTGSIFNDVIFMDNATASVNAGAGYDYVVYNVFDGSGASFNLAAMNAEGGIGREGNDVLDASGVTNSFVTLFGYGGADTLLGGAGNDYIYMDAADLSGGNVQGGAGYDYLINQGGTALSVLLVSHGAEGFFGSSAAETISAAGLTTFTTIFSGGGADTITGSAQGDSIYLTNSFASVNAGAGYDYVIYEPLDGTGAANWNLAAMNAEGAIGRDGNDTFNAAGVTTFATLYGYGGNDTMTGGAFDDVFYGGTGNDTMTGNAGNDRFVFETGWGSDTITDFAAGADRLIMRASGLTSFAQLSVTQSGADTLVTFGSQQIRLSNINAATIDASSFQFLASAEAPDTGAPLAEAPSDTFDFSRLAETAAKADTPVMELTGAGHLWTSPQDQPLADSPFTDLGHHTFDFVERNFDDHNWDMG